MKTVMIAHQAIDKAISVSVFPDRKMPARHHHKVTDASCKRLSRLLDGLKPVHVNFDHTGLFVSYDVDRLPVDNHVVWYPGAEKLIGKHPGIVDRIKPGRVS